jgi:hypothetical protein
MSKAETRRQIWNKIAPAAPIKQKRLKDSDDISDDVAAFLAKGGEIETVDQGDSSVDVTFADWYKKRI